MKYFLIYFLISLQVLPSLGAFAEKSQSVDQSPELQLIINQIYIQIIRSFDQEQKCLIFQSPDRLSESTGIDVQAAQILLKECKTKTKSENYRYNKKKHIFIFSENQTIDSWTNLQNETFIYLKSHFTIEDLYSILIHELAMTFDAKSMMYFSHYLLFSHSKRSKNLNGRLFIELRNFNSEELQVNQMFNLALWTPIRFTFAALRAFHFENFVLNNKMIIPDHETCQNDFLTYFNLMKNTPTNFDRLNTPIDSALKLLTVITDESNGPKTEMDVSRNLDIILSSRLLLSFEKRQITFCQYMSIPLLTSNSYFLSFANGPRPRLTNPNNGQGGGQNSISSLISDKKNFSFQLNPQQTVQFENFKSQFNQNFEECSKTCQSNTNQNIDYSNVDSKESSRYSNESK